MKKNILICLEQLGIGGVETFVYNQINYFINKNCNVYVLAKDGIYSSKLKEMGVKIYNFDYKLIDNYDEDNILFVNNIIKSNKIDEIHIHQYPCIMYVLPAIVENNVPYVAYVHSIVNDVFEWFMSHYQIYKNLFQIYFDNANRIITITQNVKDNLVKTFNIKKEKVEIINNCIDFNSIIVSDKVNSMSKFLIISRMADEKKVSIINSINLFKKYLEKKDATLTIVGDGPIMNYIIKYVNDENLTNKVNFVGASNDTFKYIDENDIILGIDRCILEAICFKKVAIVSGYDGLKGIVDSSNINKFFEENFSGNNFKNINETNIIEKLSKIDIKTIVDDNYQFVKENCNINDKDFFTKNNETNYNNLKQFFIIHKLYLDLIMKYNNDKNNYEEQLNKINNDKELIEKNLQEVKSELNNVVNSKRWKFVNKIFNIIKR